MGPYTVAVVMAMGSIILSAWVNEWRSTHRVRVARLAAVCLVIVGSSGSECI